MPLDVVSNTFCASGALLSNGTMVSHSKGLYQSGWTAGCRSVSAGIPQTERVVPRGGWVCVYLNLVALRMVQDVRSSTLPLCCIWRRHGGIPRP
jgi:hypothetical protein